ncbi:carbamoyltransferase HypF [Allosaccharopolyspora coralli]|uniref:Carbamoyltransferase n=1 Tax=Allosaccharopolyspora coralli TaxID=2665642 RepID=A0A5Q3QE08_9PSEU|nr:carbamoyltransferase HypF [Allosaccharopolyspora coralli]QGK69729.1 carbamoyltransferase HypF [Allosaccharopolyspora coralli]
MAEFQGGQDTVRVVTSVRYLVRVEGVVQGVGFRPFVHSLATRLGLTGHVGNDVHGVFIEVEASLEMVDRFLTGLRDEAPPLAVVEQVRTEPLTPQGTTSFTISESTGGGVRDTLVSADSATCADCLREMRDPADRRFGYAFVNCTNCGPRFTIVRDVPYDRPLTTMAGFPMCAECRAEYDEPTDRRFHAQPVCCPRCGPRLRFTTASGRDVAGDPLTAAAAALDRGEVVAVKGLGGFHLAVAAGHHDAAATLRKRKHREDKPFAVMVSDVDAAARLCRVGDVEAELLRSRRRPIVLMDRLDGAPVAEAVAPGNRQLGLMLPYTPLHHLLVASYDGPIVLTSGNLSDEPIAHEDDDAARRLAGIADAFLGHDRPIHVRTDDSVVRVSRGGPLLLRRSRGYAPEPVTVPWEFPRPVLACGAELKNTFAVAKHKHVFVSHHIGDLENFETLTSFTTGVEHYRRLFDTDPVVVAHDLHPEYLSTKYAWELDDVELVGVQHHHAHIASCLADNGDAGPVLGVAFDGLGFGCDAQLWGGEFLLAGLTGFHRLAHLRPVPLPGGPTAIRQPWRMAVAYLVGGGQLPDLGLFRRNERWRAVARLAESGDTQWTSSAGRLFDAVAAALDVRDRVTFEGQAAIELEQLADRVEPGAYDVPILDGRPPQLDGPALVRAVCADAARGASTPVAAARFHNGLVAAVTRMCLRLRDETGVSTVALSGGVFQNMLLAERTSSALTEHGLRVLTHSRVPPNDGGISLGQAAVAGALDREQRSPRH